MVHPVAVICGCENRGLGVLPRFGPDDSLVGEEKVAGVGFPGNAAIMPLQMNSIQRLAKAHGIQVSYIAATGEERTTPEETLRRMLGILGVEEVSEKEAGRLLREKKVKAAATGKAPPGINE